MQSFKTTEEKEEWRRRAFFRFAPADIAAPKSEVTCLLPCFPPLPTVTFSPFLRRRRRRWNSAPPPSPPRKPRGRRPGGEGLSSSEVVTTSLLLPASLPAASHQRDLKLPCPSFPSSFPSVASGVLSQIGIRHETENSVGGGGTIFLGGGEHFNALMMRGGMEHQCFFIRRPVPNRYLFFRCEGDLIDLLSARLGVRCAVQCHKGAAAELLILSSSRHNWPKYSARLIRPPFA